MYCTNCGKQIGDNVQFYPSCGKQVGGQTPPQTQTPPQQTQTPPVQPQTPPQQTASGYQTVSSPQSSQLGTTWLTVLPFLLGLGVIMNSISVIQFFSSGISLGDLLSIPTIGPIMGLAIVSTIALVVIGILAIVNLVKRKKQGYQMLFVLYGIQVVVNLIVLMTVGGYMDTSTTLIALIVGAVMFAVNYVYFGKRKHLFS